MTWNAEDDLVLAKMGFRPMSRTAAYDAIRCGLPWGGKETHKGTLAKIEAEWLAADDPEMVAAAWNHRERRRLDEWRKKRKEREKDYDDCRDASLRVKNDKQLYRDNLMTVFATLNEETDLGPDMSNRISEKIMEKLFPLDGL